MDRDRLVQSCSALPVLGCTNRANEPSGSRTKRLPCPPPFYVVLFPPDGGIGAGEAEAAHLTPQQGGGAAGLGPASVEVICGAPWGTNVGRVGDAWADHDGEHISVVYEDEQVLAVDVPPAEFVTARAPAAAPS